MEALRQKREGAYAELLEHTIRAFNGSQGSDALPTVRASMTVWGSRELLQQLATWQREAYRIMREQGGVLRPDERRKIQLLVGEIARCARLDLGLHPAKEPPAEELAVAIFDDYEPEIVQ